METGPSAERELCSTGADAAMGTTSHSEERSGELPLTGSLGPWASTALRLALPGPNGG